MGEKEKREEAIKSLSVYTKIEYALDNLLGKLNPHELLIILELIRKNDLYNHDRPKYDEMLINYIILTAIQEFKLDFQKFYTSKEHKYIYARMICFHIIKKIIELSFTKLSKTLKQTRRTAQYQHDKCKRIIAKPNNDLERYIKKKYTKVDEMVIIFISRTFPEE